MNLPLSQVFGAFCCQFTCRDSAHPRIRLFTGVTVVRHVTAWPALLVRRGFRGSYPKGATGGSSAADSGLTMGTELIRPICDFWPRGRLSDDSHSPDLVASAVFQSPRRKIACVMNSPPTMLLSSRCIVVASTATEVPLILSSLVRRRSMVAGVVAPFGSEMVTAITPSPSGVTVYVPANE